MNIILGGALSVHKFMVSDVVASAWSDFHNLRKNRRQLLFQYFGMLLIASAVTLAPSLLRFSESFVFLRTNFVFFQLLAILGTALSLYMMAPTIVALHRFAATAGADQKPVPNFVDRAAQKYWAWAFVLILVPSLLQLIARFVFGGPTTLESLGQVSPVYTIVITIISIAQFYFAFRLYPLLPAAALDPEGVTLRGAYNLTANHFLKIIGAGFMLYLPAFLIIMGLVIAVALIAMVLPTSMAPSEPMAFLLSVAYVVAFVAFSVVYSVATIFLSTHIFMKLNGPNEEAQQV